MGRVTAAEGAPPIPGETTVEVSRSLEVLARDGRDTQIDRSTHVVDGHYEFRALPVVDGVAIEVASPKHSSQDCPVEALEAGRTRTTDVRLLRGGTLRGRVVGPDGSGVAKAAVRALRPGRWFGFDDEATREADTADDGSFELQAVRIGAVRLTAKKDGFLAAEPLKLVVADGAVQDGLVVTLGLGNSIQGSVSWPDGRPARELEVQVRFDQSQLYGMTAFSAARGAEGSARTDEQGAFVVHGLGAGPFTVLVEAQEDGPKGAERAPTAQSRYRARRDDVKPNTQGLELRLAAPITLSGRVEDPLGAPVKQYSLLAQRVGKGLLKNLGQEHERKTIDDESGAFHVELPRDGDWELLVDAQDYAASEALAVALPRPADAAEIVIRLERGARVRGHVQDPLGLSVSGATVELVTGEPAWMHTGSGRKDASARTDGEGRFLLTGLRAGAVRLVADAKGFAQSTEVGVDLVAGDERSDVVITLRVGGRLVGEVFDDGRPAAGRLIQATRTGTVGQSVGFSDSAGKFVLEHLEPGTYQIVALSTAPVETLEEDSKPDAAALISQLKMATAEIVDGQDTHVVLGAPPSDPVHVHGRVTHGGDPYKDAMVVFMGESKDVLAGMKTASVGPDGDYAVDLDAPGRYAVTVQRFSGKPGEQQSVEFQRAIPAAKDYLLDLVMPNGRISGRVLGPDGTPASGVSVSVVNEDGREARSMFGGQFVMSSTDADGRYDLQALRPGNYTVSAGGSPFGGLLGDERTFGRASRKHLHLVDGGWLKDVDFRLEKPGEVVVTVVGPDDQPLAEAGVFARDSDGQLVEALSMLQSGTDGKARYSGLSSGRYTFSARREGLVSAESAAVEVEAGATREVRLALGKGTLLRVRVLDAHDEPAAAQLFVFDSAGRHLAGMLGIQEMQQLLLQGNRDRDEHRIGPLAPGKYRARAVRSDGKVLEKPLSLSGQAERSVTLKFED